MSLTKRKSSRVGVLSSIVLLVVSCGLPPSISKAEERAAIIKTTGCGFASDSNGSGVAVGGALVLTVAHLVVRAETVTVALGDAGAQPADVLAVDRETDLAVVRLRGLDTEAVEMADVGKEALGWVVGGQASGTVGFEVRRVVDLSIEEVGGTERHRRRGYELAATTRDGDSGSGVYDAVGNLIGLVFASGPEEDTTWVTASSEIESFLAGVGPDASYDLCS